MKINSVARNISPRIVSWMITALLALLLLAGWLVDLHPLRWETLPGALGVGVIALAGLAGAGLSLLALHRLARLFVHWFPVARAYELTYTQADQEDLRLRTRYGTLLFLALAAALTVFLRLILPLLVHVSDSLALALYVIPTCPGFWMLPTLVAGCSLAALFTYVLYRWRMKGRFPRFLAFHNQRLRFDQRKACLAFVIFGLLLSLGLAWIGLNHRVRLDFDGMVVERFFGVVEERHAYSEISLIQEHSEEQAGGAFFTVEFQDGSQWRGGMYASGALLDSAREALEYAAQRSGAPLIRVE